MSLHRRGAIPEGTQQSKHSTPYATRRTATVPQESVCQTSRPNAINVSRNRLSVASSSSSGQRSAGSGDEGFSTGRGLRQTTTLPRLTTAQSNSRPEAVPSTRRPQPSASMNRSKPELVGRSIGVYEKDRTTNMLRRKTPSIEKYTARNRQTSEAQRPAWANLTSQQQYDRDVDDAIFGIAFPETRRPLKTKITIPPMEPQARPEELPPSLIPELQALAASSELSETQAFPAAAAMSSPSSLFSASSEPWSSRNTTPTSMSSYSPGIIQPLKLNPPVRRQGSMLSQLRETRSRGSDAAQSSVPKLPVVREALTSSSSVSVYRDPATPQKDVGKAKSRKTPSPAPTPPPRKSSFKFKSPRAKESVSSARKEDVEAVASAYENRPNEQLRRAPDSQLDQPPDSPLGRKAANTIDHVGQSLEALPTPKPRRKPLPSHPAPFPNRGGSSERGLKAFPIAQDNASNLSNRGRRLSEFQQTHLNNPEQQFYRKLQDSTVGAAAEAPQADPVQVPVQSTPVNTPPKSGLRAFFSRRTKTPPATEQIRKGPAAGTGHEGYQKHTLRKRKKSTETTTSNESLSLGRGAVSSASRPSTSRKDSSSTRRDSRTSKEDPERDRFVAQRLEPVVILGGGGYRNRPESDAPSVWPSLDQSQAPNRAEVDRSTYGAMPDTTRLGGIESSTPQLTSASGDNGLFLRQAPQNQIHPSQTTTPEPTQAPNSFTTLPSMDTYYTSQSSLSPSANALPVVESEMHKVDAKYLKKPSKKGRSLKWNFFQRGQQSSKVTKTVEPNTQDVTEVPVTITTVPNPRSVPYYALIDSETENENTDTLGDFLAQSVDSPPLAPAGVPLQYSPNPDRRHGHSILLPSAPVFEGSHCYQGRAASPKVTLRREIAETEGRVVDDAKSKPRRLAQVGRIPRVISRKDHHHVPPVESYSRPFSRGRIEPVPSLTVSTTVADAERPILGIHTDVLPSRPFDDFDSAKPASAPARALMSQDSMKPQPDREFLTFASKHGSEVSMSSSSEGFPSFVAPRRLFSGPQIHGEEEVWNEYDDLIDRVLSNTSSEVAPSQSRDYPGNPTMTDDNQGLTTQEAAPWLPAVSTSSMLPPSTWLASSRVQEGSSEDVRLRRSRIVSALHSSVSPSSPFSLADLVAEYEERNRVSTQYARRTSDSTLAEPTYLPSLAYGSLPSVSIPTQGHQSSTFLLDVAERDHAGPAAQSDLHFAALMTSKWLSFGSVLFSPAGREIESGSPGQHILVIDGLGNSDWAFYCALTYPSATIYDLKESDIPARPTTNEPWRAPPNYRSVVQASLAERFPFSTSFFTAVVLRFPPAMSDGIMKLMLSECKRVLMPGGHIEISLLDIDMVNMGNHTRRAVRDLKVRMNVADPEVSLKPISDNIQSMLGRKGFEKLNRCVVQIPVAGKVAGSLSSSSSSRSSDGSYTQTARDIVTGTQTDQPTSHQRRHHEQASNFSLSDLIADHSPTSDEKITKMVAKVGRYWYTRVYESGVLTNGELKRSIWADKKVLHECKTRGSGFKLLIAYAQKPSEHKRRTVSEPSLPTLATAGVAGMKRMR